MPALDDPFAPGGDVVTRSTGDEPDPDFVDAVRRALQHQGVPISHLTPTYVNSVARRLWADQDMQDAFDYYQTQPGDPVATLATYIRNQAFNPDQRPDLAAELIPGIAQAGGHLTSAQLALGADDRAAQVPRLTEADYPITETHAEGDPGLDIGTPVGTPVVAPFGGTVHLEDGGTTNWGYRAIVTMFDGSWYAVGHLTSFEGLREGQVIQPGSLLGLSGGAEGDPHGGHTIGSGHIEFMAGQKGSNPHDVSTFMDPTALWEGIQKGMTFAEAAVHFTSDARTLLGAGILDPATRRQQLGIDPFLTAQYPSITSDFRSLVGRQPTAKDILAILQCAGSSDPSRTLDCIRSLPSGAIAGLSVGQHADARSLIDSTSNKVLGHPGTDGIVKDLWAQGITSPSAINLWYNDHSPAAIGITERQYNSIYKANQGHVSGKLGDNGFDPRIAQEQAADADATGDATWRMPRVSHLEPPPGVGSTPGGGDQDQLTP